ncbi:MAG TPA: DUF3365 domain-containing protein [Leptolyngbyaceae cyanobacterium]
MLRNLKLTQKFNLILILVVLVGIGMSGLALSTALNQKAETEVTSKTLLLMDTISAVRTYTNDRVNPLLMPILDTQPEFLAESIPSYAAREVFESLRSKPIYNELFYKDATLNPTNLRDKADDFETELVENLRKNPNLKELNGYRKYPSGELFYIARPIKITDQNCLVCHSIPAAAPKSQIATYGSENGFGWKLNEIVGTQVVYVPASEVMNKARRSFLIVMQIVTAAFALAIFITNVLLKIAVVSPIKQIAKVANEVSTGNMEAEFDQNYNDEIGLLATAFNRMKVSLSVAMNMLNQRRDG